MVKPGQVVWRTRVSAGPSAAPAALSSDLEKPLYIRIQEYLAERIFSGDLAPDTKLPSERELSRELEISRMTVRRAITELVNEGLLTRRHGSGTYVAKPRISYDARELVSYTQAMRSRGIAVGNQLLEFNQAPASRRLAERLQVEIGAPLYRVVRLRLANRVPAILERVFLPCDRTTHLEEYDLERSSIHDLLAAGYGVRVQHVTQTIEAVTASDNVAKQLRVEEGFPLLMVSRTIHRAGDGKPVLYSQDLLRSDYARIHLELGAEEVGDQRREERAPPERRKEVIDHSPVVS
jgi:GntR family transcriptional regulator